MIEILCVVVGALLAVATKLVVQYLEHRHQHRLSADPAKDIAKDILTTMLEHASYTDRSFAALRKAVGGYDDKELRILLHEVGARRSQRGDDEWWYLMRRWEERIDVNDPYNPKHL